MSPACQTVINSHPLQWGLDQLIEESLVYAALDWAKAGFNGASIN